MKKLLNTVIGASGIGAVEATKHMPMEDIGGGDDTQILVKLLCQVTITVVTIIGLLRKKKESKP